MWQAKAIVWITKAVMALTAIGIGIWYISSSIGGGSIGYVSLTSFLQSTGACHDGICDIASTHGCFLCGYVEKLFGVIGVATEHFWNAIINVIWILMAGGFLLFLFVHTYKQIMEQNKRNAEMGSGARELFFKNWFDPVKKQLIRILIAGAFIGAIGFGGTAVLKTVAAVIITPIMYVGSYLSMIVSGVATSAQCGTDVAAVGIMGPALKPFMCVVGNLNTMFLAGASGGFALMNYSWMGIGGGLMTWGAGLGLVMLFLVIGFNIFWEVLNVVFRLVFVILFLPLFIAGYAFEETWALMKGASTRAIDILINTAVRILAISLKVVILYATVSYAADAYFPGPVDNYSAILPPGIIAAPDAETVAVNRNDLVTASVAGVFAKCEKVATNNGAQPADKDLFKQCFLTERAVVEAAHPGAFDFMDDGWDFIVLMLGLALVYFYVIDPKITTLLGSDKDQLKFNFGDQVKTFGQYLYDLPGKIAKNVGDAVWGDVKK